MKEDLGRKKKCLETTDKIKFKMQNKILVMINIEFLKLRGSKSPWVFFLFRHPARFLINIYKTFTWCLVWQTRVLQKYINM